MNIKIKILSILNLISYLLMGFIYCLTRFECLSNLNNNNMVKFFVGISLQILIVSTSFILAKDTFKEFTIIKNEARLDWTARLLAYIILLGGINHLENNYIIISILILMTINISIECIMNKKLKHFHIEDDDIKIYITYEEKCNLRNMVKATNSTAVSFLIFCGLSISVPTLTHIEGTEKRAYILIIVSIIVTIWFIKTNYNNYMKFYLDKSYGKRVFIKNSAFALLGYMLCLGLSFADLKEDLYYYIF